MDNFMIYYNDKHVTIFFKQMNNMQTKENMDAFASYHTIEILDNLMELFPPPNIWDLWNRWNK